MIEYDRVGTTRSLTYWIDGVDRGTISQTISNLPTEKSFDHLDVACGEGSAYFDNVQVSSVPEPSTFWLLGVGAAGLVGYGFRRVPDGEKWGSERPSTKGGLMRLRHPLRCVRHWPLARWRRV